MKALYSILFVMSFFLSLSSARATEANDLVSIYARAYLLDLDGSLHAITPEEGMHRFSCSTHIGWDTLLATLRLTLLAPGGRTTSITLLQLNTSIGVLANELPPNTIRSHFIATYPQNQPSEIVIVFYATLPSNRPRQLLHHRTCILKPSFVSSLPSRSE